MIKKFVVNLFFLILLVSCNMLPVRNSEQKKGVRFVDAKGKPVLLERRVPKFNQEQLSKQNMSDSNIRLLNANINHQDSLQYDSPNLTNRTHIERERQTNVIDIKEEEKHSDVVVFKPTQEEKQLKEGLVERRRANQKTTSASAVKSENNKAISSEKKQNSQTNPETLTAVSQFNRQERKDVGSNDGTFYIQIGAYRNKTNAEQNLQRYSNIRRGTVKSYTNRSGVIIYRTVLGPYNSRSQAEVDLEKVIQRGHYDVYITRE
jgi:cell division protein FtsN